VLPPFAFFFVGNLWGFEFHTGVTLRKDNLLTICEQTKDKACQLKKNKTEEEI
jgi:hypothetical protein